MTKFLDYDGLKLYNNKVKALISAAKSIADKATTSAGNANTAAATAQATANSALNAAKAAQETADNCVDATWGAEMPGTAVFDWYDDETGGHVRIEKGRVYADYFMQWGYEGDHGFVMGTDGVPKEMTVNGGAIVTLNYNNKIPNHYLDIDTTLFQVVTALPTSGIKNRIYILKDTNTNSAKYPEYIYTGDINAAYDATKWEKLGDFNASVDLAPYQKTADAVKTISANINTDNGYYIYLRNAANTILSTATIPAATTSGCGLMTKAMVTKLNGIATGANAYSLPTASSSTLGGIKVGTTLSISSGVLNILTISETEINQLFA